MRNIISCLDPEEREEKKDAIVKLSPLGNMEIGYKMRKELQFVPDKHERELSGVLVLDDKGKAFSSNEIDKQGKGGYCEFYWNSSTVRDNQEVVFSEFPKGGKTFALSVENASSDPAFIYGESSMTSNGVTSKGFMEGEYYWEIKCLKGSVKIGVGLDVIGKPSSFVCLYSNAFRIPLLPRSAGFATLRQGIYGQPRRRLRGIVLRGHLWGRQ